MSVNVEHLRLLLSNANRARRWYWHEGGAHGQYERSKTIAMGNGALHELNVLKTDDDWGGEPEDLDLIVGLVNAAPDLLDEFERMRGSIEQIVMLANSLEHRADERVQHFRDHLRPDDPEGKQHVANSNRAFGADVLRDDVVSFRAELLAILTGAA